MPEQAVNCEDALRWTDAMRQRTHGRRGFWHAPLDIDEKGVIERLGEAENRKWLEEFRFDETCAPFRQRLLDTPADRLYPLEDDPCLEGVRAAVYRLAYQWTIVPYWCREKGPAFALQALIWQHRVYYTNFWVRLEYDREYLDLESWRALRNGVAAAAPEAYAEAVQVAERLRRELAGTREQAYRLGIAHAFPDRADWGMEEAASQVAQRSVNPYAVCLLGSVADLDVLGQLARKILKLPADDYTARTWDLYVPDLLANVGLPALPVLLAMFEGARKAGHKQTVADCLAVIESDEVARFFVQHLADKHVARVGAAWLTRNLERFVRVLSRLEKPPDTATGLLAQLRQKDPARVLAAEGAGSDAPEAGSETLAGIVEATAGQMPSLLVHPPWMDKLKRKSITVAVPSMLDCAEYVEWEAGEQETVGIPLGYRDERVDLGQPSPERDEMVRADLDAYRKDIRQSDRARPPILPMAREWSRFSVALMAMTDAGALSLLTPGVDDTDNRVHWGLMLPLFTRFGMAPLPLLISLVMESSNAFLSDTLLPQLARMVSPRVGQAMGRLAGGRKNQRPVARAWLQKHPEEGAIGIIPVAVGGSGAERTKAESALRWMARVGHRATLESVAERYGSRVSEAVREILESDLGFDRLPKMPGFWTPDAWPRPLLKAGGFGLPRAAVDHLGTMLAVSTLDEPHYGLETVRDACTPESLAGFAESLCDAWLVAGMPAPQAWAFHALAHLGDEGTVRKLVGYLNKWPAEGAGGRTRTMTGLDILAAQGSNLALLHVQRMSQTARHRAIQEKAATTLEEAAQARGLTLAELEDRLVPHLGLDARGSLRLDFGPRAFTVRFDEQLEPFVVDADGARLLQFPRVQREDDAEKARVASDLYKQLREDVTSVAGTQVRRLEQAMCQLRRWGTPEFERYLLRHPLMCHLVRRLVWATFGDDDRPGVCFRVAEDGTLASVDDRTISLPEGVRIGIPHRLEFSNEQAAAWGTVLGDYAIAQPFPQVGRDTYSPAPEELERESLARPEVHTKGSRLRGLGHRGWRMAVDSTWVHLYEKVLPDGTRLTLSFEPGWDVTAPSDGEQTAQAIRCSIPIARLSPVVYSEMVRDYLWLQA